MIIFQEKIDPPPTLSDQVRPEKRLESKAEEERWIKNIVDALNGVIRDARDSR